MELLLFFFSFHFLFSKYFFTFVIIPVGEYIFCKCERLKDIILSENLDNWKMLDNKQERSRHGCIYPYVIYPNWRELLFVTTSGSPEPSESDIQ